MTKIISTSRYDSLKHLKTFQNKGWHFIKNAAS